MRPPALHPSLVARCSVLLLALDLVDTILDELDTLLMQVAKFLNQFELLVNDLQFRFTTWQAILIT
jgi:hypothetical protein